MSELFQLYKLILHPVQSSKSIAVVVNVVVRHYLYVTCYKW